MTAVRTAARSAAPRRAPERRRPDLRVVPTPRPRRLRNLTRLLTVVTIAGFFGVLFGLAAFHASLAQGQYELDELEDQLTELAERRVELELTAQRLESPDRVATIARDVLGLVSPEHTEDLYPTADRAAAVLDAGASAGAPSP